MKYRPLLSGTLVVAMIVAPAVSAIADVVSSRPPHDHRLHLRALLESEDVRRDVAASRGAPADLLINSARRMQASQLRRLWL